MPPQKKGNNRGNQNKTRGWDDYDDRSTTSGFRAKRVNGDTFIVYRHDDGFECKVPGFCTRPGHTDGMYHCC